MARTAKPWYAADKKCYLAYVKGRRVRLLKGAKNATNYKQAKQNLKQVLKSKEDPSPDFDSSKWIRFDETCFHAVVS